MHGAVNDARTGWYGIGCDDVHSRNQLLFKVFTHCTWCKPPKAHHVAACAGIAKNFHTL